MFRSIALWRRLGVVIAIVVVSLLIIEALYSELLWEAFGTFFQELKENQITQHQSERDRQQLEAHDKLVSSWQICHFNEDCMAIVKRCGIYAVNKESYETANKYYSHSNEILNCRSTLQPKLSDYDLVCFEGHCKSAHKK